MVRIGFSTTRRWISRLIRWTTRAEVSHAFLVYYDEVLRQDVVLDVAFSGYRMLPYEAFRRENDVVVVLEPPVDLRPALPVLARWMGIPYDWRAFVAFNRWFRSLRRPTPAEDPKALICSEVVVHALRLAGCPGAAALDPKATSPQALLDFLRGE